ncbi:universal stress protein [Helicovermis profundi]|uniref:UspA domain-containing protein n=1 Tax=Helicovermis profundi TaxID=3065157 RepID=A0AAU9E4C5_9FIRM|nr:hypothetical protein HLPR_04390 [Clostridia bacterium S502]
MRNRKKIMVCVTQQKSCERLIQRGNELRKNDSDELFVIHVVKENWKYFGKLKESDAIEYLFDVSKEYGANLTVIKSKKIEETLGNAAEENKIDIIVMGESFESNAQQNMINRLQKKTKKEVVFDIVSYENIENII